MLDVCSNFVSSSMFSVDCLLSCAPKIHNTTDLCRKILLMVTIQCIGQALSVIHVEDGHQDHQYCKIHFRNSPQLAVFWTNVRMTSSALPFSKPI